MTTEKYSKVSASIHWVTATLLIYMLLFGEDLIVREDGTSMTTAPYAWVHATIGTSILLLTLLRMGWFLVQPAPADLSLGKLEHLGAKLVKYLFYVVMIGMPVTGFLALTEYAQEHPNTYEAVKFFNVFNYPQTAVYEWAGEAHEWGVTLAIALLAVHVIGAVKHQFFDGTPILTRMSLFK